MNPDFPLRTWTVYPDYGNAPIVWAQPGLASGPAVGSLLLHASDMEDILPDPLGKEFDHWGCAWESIDPEKMDWLSFHQEGLRLTALLALWVAPLNIMVRYSPPYEDTRFDAHDSECWMEPSAVARLAQGQPDIQDDRDAWSALLALYDYDLVQPWKGGSFALGSSPTSTPAREGCVPP